MSKDFGWALEQIRNGERVARTAWITTRKSSYIGLETPGPTQRMNQPFIYMGGFIGTLQPWVPTSADLLGRDWELYSVAARLTRGAFTSAN